MNLKNEPLSNSNGQAQPNEPTPAPNSTPSAEFSRDELYDSQDMLQKFHISQRTLFNWRSKGMIRFIQLGKKIYYPRMCVEEMLQKHLRKR